MFWPLRRVGAEFHSARSGTLRWTGLLADRKVPDPPSGCLALDSPGTTDTRRRAVGRRTDGAGTRRLDRMYSPGADHRTHRRQRAGKGTTRSYCRTLTPDRGRVTVDGIDVGEPDLNHWWRQLCWLPQRPHPGFSSGEPHLPGSGGRHRISLQRNRFRRRTSLPNGLDTQLGRGGLGLSLGERQRLGLARVLGSRAPILLWTNRRPTSMSAERRRCCTPFDAAGATVVMVGHRGTALAVADQVVTVESSPHDRA